VVNALNSIKENVKLINSDQSHKSYKRKGEDDNDQSSKSCKRHTKDENNEH
jgi:hypothetical protein